MNLTCFGKPVQNKEDGTNNTLRLQCAIPTYLIFGDELEP